MSDKNLKTLFESSLLTEEAKTVLKETWDEAVQANRSEVEAEYATKLNEARSDLNSSAVEMIEEAVTQELASVAEELADARTLEYQYAEKLQTFKEQYAQKSEELIESLVTESVREELDELKEDIDFAKKHQFGIRLYEAFSDTYKETFGESDMDVQSELKEAKDELAALKREKVINSLLESIESKEKREVVSTILENVETDKLEAKFESLRPVVLAEADDEEEEEEDEKGKKKDKEEVKESKNDPKGKVVLESESGNRDTKESEVDDKIMNSLRESLKRIK